VRTELIEIGLVEAEPDLHCVEALALTTETAAMLEVDRLLADV
jgi:hypothetical protein